MENDEAKTVTLQVSIDSLNWKRYGTRPGRSAIRVLVSHFTVALRPAYWSMILQMQRALRTWTFGVRISSSRPTLRTPTTSRSSCLVTKLIRRQNEKFLWNKWKTGLKRQTLLPMKRRQLLKARTLRHPSTTLHNNFLNRPCHLIWPFCNVYLSLF